jgi:hypothetical protein
MNGALIPRAEKGDADHFYDGFVGHRDHNRCSQVRSNQHDRLKTARKATFSMWVKGSIEEGCKTGENRGLMIRVPF